MSLQLAKGYARFDSSHIRVCDSKGMLHDDIFLAIQRGKKTLKIEKKEKIKARKKTKYNEEYEAVSLRLGHRKNYIYRILSMPKDDELYLFLLSLSEDMAEAVQIHHKMKIDTRARLKKMADELNEAEKLRFGRILAKEDYLPSRANFLVLLENIERNKIPIRRASRLIKDIEILNRYEKFKNEI